MVFNADKRCILGAADRCTKPGEVSTPMRREGVYSSSLSTWRRQREAVELAASAMARRGPKADPHRVETLPIARLTRERDDLKSRLDRALLVIDVQKTCSLAGPLDQTQRRLALIAAVHELSPVLGSGAACQAPGPPHGVPARQHTPARRAATGVRACAS